MCVCVCVCVWSARIYRVFWKVSVGSDVVLARQLLLLPEVARVLTLTAALPSGFEPQWAAGPTRGLTQCGSAVSPAYIRETLSELRSFACIYTRDVE